MPDDIEYYRRRAEAELEKAQRAASAPAVAAHRLLADAYLERIGEFERAGTAAIAVPATGLAPICWILAALPPLGSRDRIASTRAFCRPFSQGPAAVDTTAGRGI